SRSCSTWCATRSTPWYHGVDRVAHQVEHDLLDLNLVGQDQANLRAEFVTHADAVLLRADQCEGAGLLDQLGQILDRPLGLSTSDAVAQTANDVPGAQRFGGGALDRVGDLRVRNLRAAQQHPAALQVVGDGR